MIVRTDITGIMMSSVRTIIDSVSYALIAFSCQWGLYEAVATGVSNNDTLQLLSILPFSDMWKPVAGVFLAAGILMGVGGSLSAIRKFLRV